MYKISKPSFDHYDITGSDGMLEYSIRIWVLLEYIFEYLYSYSRLSVLVLDSLKYTSTLILKIFICWYAFILFLVV